jgi:hypothetical protein
VTRIDDASNISVTVRMRSNTMSAQPFGWTSAVIVGLALIIVGSEIIGSSASDARGVGAPAAQTATPVAVELFTSQGCSSCPPADALVARLAQEPGIVVMTRPVTYWDNLGWKDTLAREGNTALQRAYAERGGNGAGVYTPQAMVQGRAAVVGSSEYDLRRLIADARSQPGPDITIAQTPDGGRSIAIEGSAPQRVIVTLVALRSNVTVRIGNGENGGRSIRYANVVVEEQPVGTWTGGRGRFAIPAEALHVRGADRAALILQQGHAGAIVAARLL